MDFRISVEDRGEVYRGINIQIPRAMYNQELQTAAARASRQVKLKGFRPGRVPPNLVAKMYGPELRAEVLDQLVQQALEKAYQEHKLSVVGVSSLEVEPEQEDRDLEVKAQVALFPEPKIEKYKGFEISVTRPEVNEQLVDKYIDELLESRAKFEPRGESDTVSDGDGVLVDWVAELSGVEGKKQKQNDFYLLTGRRGKETPAEIKSALKGKKIGDEVEVTVTHGTDYRQNPELSEKTVAYTMTVKAIYELQIPELNEAFIEEVAKTDSMDEFRLKIRGDLDKEALRRFEAGREEKLFEKLIEANAFEVPQELIDHEIRNLLFEMGVLKREDRKAYQVDVTRFRDRLGKRAEFRVRAGVILSQIKEQENVSVEETDREDWISRAVERDNIEDKDGFSAAVRAGDREQWFEDVVLREKVVSLLLDSSKISEEKQLLEV